eukprot:m.31783 g.31783  ORF g.31783 m.31783 type:complete len:76 (-) comp9733_c0_seq2:77-304(-)
MCLLCLLHCIYYYIFHNHLCNTPTSFSCQSQGTVAIAYKYKQSLYNDAIPTSEEEKYKTANDTLENEDSSNSTTS